MTSENVPEGWTHVRKGMVAAPDTYVDDLGVLRSSGDGSCVVWHKRGCAKRGIQPSEIVYGDNGVPYCPVCIQWKAEDAETPQG